jgi:SPP1 gp7 family putative phage head morphogenesis protein
MRNSTYWKGRFEQLEEAQLKKGAEFYANLEKQYNSAISEVEKDLARWYTRYAKENKITLAEAKRQLSKRELAEFRMSVEEYIEKGKTLNYSKEWESALKKASVKFHVSRLEALKIQMQQQIEFLGVVKNDGLTDLVKGIYTDGYYKTAFEIQKGLGVGHDFMKLDSNTVNKIITKPWASDGKNFSARIWDDRTKLVNEINDTLAQNIARGVDPQISIDSIAKKFGVSKFQAGRLVMTESAFFASESSKDSMKELGVEQYEILATLDSKTSEICRDLDGKVYDLKDFESGVTAPPFHPYCRSTTCPHFEDFNDGVRASRDKDDKGYYKVPETMTYRTWHEKFIENGDKSDLASIKPKDLSKVVDTVGDKIADIIAMADLDNIALKRLKDLGVEESSYTAHAEALTDDEIIKQIGGGDKTDGSCVSMAFAYTANKHGLDVLDFRGGVSQKFFSRNFNIDEISKFDGLKVKTTRNENDLFACEELLADAILNKEYILITGRHASVIKKVGDTEYEYLELQSSMNSGWHKVPILKNLIKDRFKGKVRSGKYAYKTWLFDVESFKGNANFYKMLQYINTKKDKQMKGTSGYAK